MRLSILTLDKTLYEGEAKSVSVPGIYGRLQVLDHHVPLITALKKGKIKIEMAKDAREFEVEGGVLEIRLDEVNILLH
ncbi:MAG: hypothetical protein HY001_01845 [Candidatus Portnoybacteria bacterium]|nr:hypothetical protein [Candidatus Portnoybacteria bacterium]